MPQFSGNPHRHEPYRTFKFHVFLDSPEPVAGVTKVGGLKKTQEVITHRDGADQSHSINMPGQTKYEAITLEAGLTHDLTFEEWANLVNNYSADGDMSLAGYRKDVTIVLNNLQGIPVMKYLVHEAWVSEYQALPELDASANSVGIQTLTLQHNGWERLLDVSEPTET